MGGLYSKPAPDPFLGQPWRILPLGDKQPVLRRVDAWRPPSERLRLRILLHGPVGAGKSSFINSVSSILTGTMFNPADAANMSSSSFTRKWTTYEIPKEDGVYPFVLNDMMGLMGTSSRRNRRNHVKDVRRLLKGHVRDGYTFNPEAHISKEDRFYNNDPTANDQVHVLVFVIDANTQPLMNQAVVETLLDIRDEASEMGIPQMAIFTKIDEACSEIQKDLNNVYRSKLLKERMDSFSADVGLPLNCIFPVKNYHSTMTFNNETDTLILDTLTHIINAGKEFLAKKLRN